MTSTAYPGPPTFPDHGGLGATTRSPLTLQATPRSIQAMTVSSVTPGALGLPAVGVLHGVYPALYPAQARLPCGELLSCSEALSCDDGATGAFPGHGSDLPMGQPGSRVLTVTPV